MKNRKLRPAAQETVAAEVPPVSGDSVEPAESGRQDEIPQFSDNMNGDDFEKESITEVVAPEVSKSTFKSLVSYEQESRAIGGFGLGK